MTQIPTAAEYLSDNINRAAFPLIDEWIEDNNPQAKTLLKCLNEYATLKARYHVEAALQAAAERVIVNNYGGKIWADEKSITNSYPLTNIK